MRWSIHIGSIFGIRLEMHVTFLLLLAYAAANPSAFGVSGTRNGPLLAVVMLVLVFACVVLHELGHALTARRFGIRTRDIILLPIGGVARLERMPDKPQQEVLVAIAGPTVNVVLALLFGGWLALAHIPIATSGLLGLLLEVNVVMLLFNLVPAFPMDGGRVLRALLAMRLPYAQATRIASSIGQGVAIVFAAIALYYGNVILGLVAVFVFMAAGEERAIVQTRTNLSGLPVRAAMQTDFHALEAGEPLQRAVDYLMAGSQQDFPVMDAGHLMGVLTRTDLLRALQQRGAETAVREALHPDPLFAEAHEPLEQAVTRMRAGARTAVPVMHQGRLVGLLTLENVGDLLLVRDALNRWGAASG
ncbi:MAG TPA: site-2 protease family protein [Candidatus Eisenbacteria bacterium]|nr:site-2 protease family protein [Candidatus Eisenbacteria bacterium]